MLTITLPLPHQHLSPNARVHHMALSRHKKKARSDAKIAAVAAMAELGWKDYPRWDSATVQCTFYFASNRGRDKDNAAASMKAAMDGIADAGVVSNDKAFTPLPPVLEIDKDDPRVVVTITPA